MFAVIGNPIAHSVSPRIHTLFAKQFAMQITYTRICAEVADFENVVTNFFVTGGRGLNITAPFKERAFAMSVVKTDRAIQAQAANTLWMVGEQLHADNTDGVGLLRDLAAYGNLQGKRILLLGAGGAARGIIGPLLAAQLKELVVVNRTVQRAHELCKAFPALTVNTFTTLQGVFDVIINATTLHAALDLKLPEAIWETKPFCYDLVYNIAAPTPFVEMARAHQCDAVDGLGMLIAQAAESFYIWHGVRPVLGAYLKNAIIASDAFIVS